MAFNFKGKNVIITGGSKGIGAGVGQAFLKEGAQVLVTGRKEADGERFVKTMKEKGYAPEFLVSDVTVKDQVKSLYKKAQEIMGSIDIVILNAGYYPENPLDQMTEKDWDQVLDVNLKGVFLNTQAALPYLKNGGRIVITSSITGNKVGNPGLTHYSAAKAGVNGFMRTAALELAPLGITINAVEPGNIMTPGMKDVLGEEYIKKQESIIPMGKLGSPSDIAYAIMYFASDEASYVTGQSLVIDGGQILPESALDLS